MLGETIDIHGGGHDLVFPHHENERAQSTCAHGGKIFARYWLHNGFLTMDSAKMSKSVGNVLLVHELLKHAPGEAIAAGAADRPLPAAAGLERRGACRTHARSSTACTARLRELAAVAPAAGVKAPEAFIAALEDDLNTPAALAVLFDLAHAANTAQSDDEKSRIKAQLLDAGQLLGLLLQKPEAWFGWLPVGEAQLDAAQIEARVAQRGAARAAKNWKESDRIRDELKSKGVLVEDSKDGQRWRYL